MEEKYTTLSYVVSSIPVRSEQCRKKETFTNDRGDVRARAHTCAHQIVVTCTDSQSKTHLVGRGYEAEEEGGGSGVRGTFV